MNTKTDSSRHLSAPVNSSAKALRGVGAGVVMKALLLVSLSSVLPAALANDSQSLIDDMHALVSNSFIDLAGDVDGLFGGAERGGQRNLSWARIRIGTTKFESDDPELRGNIKLKLVLPRTEKRLQLLLSTEDEDNLGSADARAASLDSNAEDNVSLALRFLQSVRTNSSFRFDVGARVRDDRAQGFVRLNASRKLSTLESSNGRESVLVNNLWYFNESGYENRLKLALKQHVEWEYADFFRSVSEITWKENQRGARFVQNAGLFKSLDSATFAGVETIADLLSSPGSGEKRLQSVELRLRYRQQVWRRWFFYEVLPRIRWEAERDFSARYGIQLRAEVFLGTLGNRAVKNN